MTVRLPEKLKLVRGPVLFVLYTAERSIHPEVRSFIREIKFRFLMPNTPFLFFQVPSLPTQLHSGKVDRIALRAMAQQLLESHLEDPVQQLSSRLDICSALHYSGILSKDAVAFTVYECLYDVFRTHSD